MFFKVSPLEMDQILIPSFIVFFHLFPLELLLQTVLSTTPDNLILKDTSLISVLCSFFVIYYLSCVFFSKLLPKSAIQYLLMGVLLMLSKNSGKHSTFGYIGIYTLQICCLLVWRLPGSESSASVYLVFIQFP